jgi:hypothetical protein
MGSKKSDKDPQAFSFCKLAKIYVFFLLETEKYFKNAKQKKIGTTQTETWPAEN